MKFQGAIVKEQGVTFVVVIVKEHVTDNSAEANSAIVSFQPLFPNMPIVLMSQDPYGTPSYYGRKDIADFLSKLPLSAIPWKEYTVT